jgi:uncharacterized membrane protein
MGSNYSYVIAVISLILASFPVNLFMNRTQLTGGLDLHGSHLCHRDIST